MPHSVAGDERINGRFGNTDIPNLKGNLSNMRIQDAEFAALVEDLIKSLNKFKVGKKEQDELLGALGGMKKDIVNQ